MATQDPAAATIGWFKILQNSVLLGVSVFLYFSNSLWFSVEHYLLSRSTEPED